MRVLVVGGAGYVGGHVTTLLQHSGYHDVHVYDSLLYEDDYRKPVPFTRGDIRDKDKLRPWLDWADAVIWLAAIVGDRACDLNEKLTREVNTESVQWLSDNFEGKVIFTSTCAVYGGSNELITENYPPAPQTVYASSKLYAESYLPKDSLILRLGTLYGESDDYTRPRFDLVLNTMMASALHNKKITVSGGDQHRSLIHVKDVAKVIIDNLDTKAKGVYNLASYISTVSRMADDVLSTVGNIGIDVYRVEQEDLSYRLNNGKAVKSLGAYWMNGPVSYLSHSYDLKKWVKSDRIKNWLNPRYSNYAWLASHPELLV